jgi:hypothetical protein
VQQPQHTFQQSAQQQQQQLQQGMQQQQLHAQHPYAQSESFRAMLDAQIQQPYDTLTTTQQQARETRMGHMTYGTVDSSAPRSVTPHVGDLSFSFLGGGGGSPAPNTQVNQSMNTPRQSYSLQPRTTAASTISRPPDAEDPAIVTITTTASGVL